MTSYKPCIYLCLGVTILSTFVSLIWIQSIAEPTIKLGRKFSLHTAERWLKHLKLDKTPPKNMTSFPVIVTGYDSFHYFEAQGMIKSIHKVVRRKHPGAKLIVYDLGLLPYQRKQMEQHCACELRNFTVEKYPRHVKNLYTYAFKPIIINTVFQEYGQVWWMDASIRILSTDFDILTSLDRDGVYFFTDDPGPSQYGVVICRTVMETFHYLNTDPMMLRNFSEIAAFTVAFRNTDVVTEILRMWLLCALTEECIAPPGSKLECDDCPTNVTRNDVGKCHRFDQSALNILLFSHFPQANNRPSWIDVKRCDPVGYFAEITNQPIKFNIHC